MARLAILGCVAILAPIGAQAQETDTAARIADEISACRKIPVATERLACFDRSVAAFDNARQKRDLVVIDRAEMRKTRQSLFGFSLPRIKLFGRDDDGSDGAEVTEITSTIAAIRPAGYNQYVWQLADGSSWQTIEVVGRSAFVKAGDAITITATMLGGYKAKIKTGSIGVKRVR